MKCFVDSRSARFADVEEIKAGTCPVPYGCRDAKAGGAPVYVDDTDIYMLHRDVHTLVNGGTGSKKSRLVVMPTVRNLACAGESMVINDPKGEIHKNTVNFLKEQGYDVIVLNFRHPETGNNWNPLSIVYDYYAMGEIDKSDILLRDVAQAVFEESKRSAKDKFWPESAKNYFIGLAQVLRAEGRKEDFTIENICYMDSYGGQKIGNSTYLREYFSHFKKNVESFRNLQGVVNNDARETKSGILVSFYEPMAIFSSQNSLCDMMSRSDFDVAAMGDKKTALFLIVPDDKTTFNAIVSLFVMQSYQLMVEHAETNYSGVMPVRVNYILDEFGNLPAITDMAPKMSASRSRNIRFMLVIQNIGQLRAAYGKDTTETIISNCGAWYCLYTKDLTMLEHISHLCGQVVGGYTGTVFPLLSVAQLQTLDKDLGEVLTLLEGKHPFVTYLPDISAYGIDMACAPGDLPRRKLKMRPHFDIRKVVREAACQTLTANVQE